MAQKLLQTANKLIQQFQSQPRHEQAIMLSLLSISVVVCIVATRRMVGTIDNLKLLTQAAESPHNLYSILKSKNKCFEKIIQLFEQTVASKSQVSEEQAKIAIEDCKISKDLSRDETESLIENFVLVTKVEIEKTKFNALSEVAYSKKNTDHEAQLMKLWNLLRPEHQLKERLTNDWQLIGFQAKDPSTDFRGAGYLGLQQLLSYVENEESDALEVYKSSLVEDNWYFFAVTGINITQRLLLSLTQGEFDQVLCDYSSEILCTTQFYEVMDFLYNEVFTLFNQEWTKKKPGIMAFTQFLESVYVNQFLPSLELRCQKYADQLLVGK